MALEWVADILKHQEKIVQKSAGDYGQRLHHHHSHAPAEACVQGLAGGAAGWFHQADQ
jgi:hypothetical protein